MGEATMKEELIAKALWFAFRDIYNADLTDP
jgi:hypothetical protein